MEKINNSIEYSKNLELHETEIPGLVWFDLPVHGDNRGWFKENWQREKMVAAGLPDFQPIQNNMSYNEKVGTTRGIHAEPWDKYVSVGTGRVFGAWVDLREGETFGKKFTMEIDSSKAIFVPRGVGNSFQVLEEKTLYSYLVNDHWSAEVTNYPAVNPADATLNIKWPIPLDQAILSDKDLNSGSLDTVKAVNQRKILITGANGQLGRALQKDFPNAEFTDRDTLDITDESIVTDRNWRQYEAIINAAAYTAVDNAETDKGRIDAWKINAKAVQNLAKIAIANNLTLVHVSSDYVFDGSNNPHEEDEPFSALGVYGQTKAAGDIAAALSPKHYIARTSWVVGEGKNFVNTMASLAEKGIKPSVVNDQIGRLTFTEDLSKAIKHLLETDAPYGTYNVTNDGESVSWADIAKKVYELTGHSPDDVTGVSTEKYYEGKDGISPRPLQSTLNIAKIQSTGYAPRRWEEALLEYIEKSSHPNNSNSQN